MTRQLSEQMSAVERRVSGPPDWIDAPAVQAWHRSDSRTERDGTPGKPRIWSPGYRTTERWSTPSLWNVHWSDLVDVVPLAAPAGSYTRTDEEDWQARAIKAERERDSWESIAQQTARSIDALRAKQPRPLTPDAIESVLHDILPLTANRLGEDDITSIASDLYLALTAPARDPRAEEIQADLASAEEPEMDDEDRRLIADHLAALGYRKTGAES